MVLVLKSLNLMQLTQRMGAELLGIRPDAGDPFGD
jgi:hypothetical protein